MTTQVFTPCTPAEADIKKAAPKRSARRHLIGVEHHAKAIKAAIKRSRPALLIGGACTGKSSLAEEVAYDMGRSWVTIDMHGHMTPDQLIGRIMAKANHGTETYFQYGVLAKAMKAGSVVILNEINSVLADTLFILHSILEKRPRLYVPETEEEIIPADGFCVIATMNPEQDYAGTRELNAALFSRFDVVRRFDELKGAQLLQALREHAPTTISDELILQTSSALEDIRKARSEDRIRTIVTLRDAISALELMTELTPEDAMQSAMFGKLKPEEVNEVTTSTPPSLPATTTLAEMIRSVEDLAYTTKALAKAETELKALSKLREVMAAFAQVPA